MLDSLFNMTYSDLERVKEELKKQKLLHKVQTFECQEMKTWAIDFDFLLSQMDSLDTDLTKRKKLQNVRVTERQKSEVQEKEEQEERNRSATADEINESLGNDDNVVITMTADSKDDYVPTRSLRKPKKADKVMLELRTKDLTKTQQLCVLD